MGHRFRSGASIISTCCSGSTDLWRRTELHVQTDPERLPWPVPWTKKSANSHSKHSPAFFISNQVCQTTFFHTHFTNNTGIVTETVHSSIQTLLDRSANWKDSFWTGGRGGESSQDEWVFSAQLPDKLALETWIISIVRMTINYYNT